MTAESITHAQREIELLRDYSGRLAVIEITPTVNVDVTRILQGMFSAELGTAPSGFVSSRLTRLTFTEPLMNDEQFHLLGQNLVDKLATQQMSSQVINKGQITQTDIGLSECNR